MTQQVLILVTTFVAFTCGSFVLLQIIDPQRRRVAARVEELLIAKGADGNPAGEQHYATARFVPRVVDLLYRAMPSQAAEQNEIRTRLTKAGIYNSEAVTRFIACKVLLITAPTFSILSAAYLGYIPFVTALWAGLAAAGIGVVAPGLWLDRQIAKRHLSFRISLPDLLDLMIVCLEGGLSLQETIRRVSDELQIAHPTLAYELGIVQRDLEIGATVDQALKRFAARTDYEGIRTLATFIREAQRFGTKITEALRSHADMLRSQREQAAEESAQKAAVKILIPTLLLIFPAIFVVLVGPAIIQIQEAFSRM